MDFSMAAMLFVLASTVDLSDVTTTIMTAVMMQTTITAVHEITVR